MRGHTGHPHGLADLNGLISVTSYVYATEDLPAETEALEPSPLTQLINLRAQAEKASKQENLYNKRVGGWVSWEAVQQGRQKVVTALTQSTSDTRRGLLREAAALSLLSLIPPDRCQRRDPPPRSARALRPPRRSSPVQTDRLRVGVIRKLRLGSTLKKTSTGWAIDLTKARDSHKACRRTASTIARE